MDNPTTPRTRQTPDPGLKRDDARPPGSPHAGIAPGQLDEAAVLAATEDGAGEPLPSADVMRDHGLGAAPMQAMPQASHDTRDAGETRP